MDSQENLSEYVLVMDNHGALLLDPEGGIFIQHLADHTIISKPFEALAAHFGLTRTGDADTTKVIVPGDGPSGSCTERKETRIWTVAETKFLLSAYEENFPSVGPLMKFKNKRKLWERIAELLTDAFKVAFTATQVENRYKNVLKQNKKKVQHNKTSGNTRVTTEYDDEFRKIGSIDDTIEPFLMTQSTIERSSIASGASNESMTSPPEKKRKREPKKDLLSAYKENCEALQKSRAERQRLKEEKEKKRQQEHEEAEARRQFRHEEKIAVLDKLVNSISNLSNRRD